MAFTIITIFEATPDSYSNMQIISE